MTIRPKVPTNRGRMAPVANPDFQLDPDERLRRALARQAKEKAERRSKRPAPGGGKLWQEEVRRAQAVARAAVDKAGRPMRRTHSKPE